MVRRLAAIMFTDLVGSTELAQRDEKAALRLLGEQEELARPVLAAHHGRLVKSTGDGMLVEFGNALEAVECAAELQRRAHERGTGDGGLALRVRIGIHVGDVEERGADILGDAVNVAARVEPLAEPGGICVSSVVHEHVLHKVPFPMESLGPRTLKGVLGPVEIYRVVLPWQSAPRAATDALDRTRIAVLPFASMSPDPSDEYFADGMTEELIDRLAQVRRLTVIARTSAMSFKRTSKKASEIARELSVGSLVEGSVRKAGNRVRITVQLIHAGTEGHLWSNRYDRELDDIFEVQTEIAEKVAGELDVQLLGAEKRALEKRSTENTEAYGLFLRGRELFRDGSEARVRQALGLYEKAVELDPGFARAHVGIAECHQGLTNSGREPLEASLPLVRAALGRALELDPDLPEAHAALAQLHMNEDNGPAWEAETRRALELNPSLPEAHRMLGILAGLKGDPDGMVREVELTYRLDPLRVDYIVSVGKAYLETGREREALEHWQRTEHLTPRPTASLRAEYYLSKGKVSAAEEWLARYETLTTEPVPGTTYLRGLLAARKGDLATARAAVAELEHDPVLGAVGFTFVGAVSLALGDLDACFDYLDRALAAHTLAATEVLYSPTFAKARSDPRFARLVEKLRQQSGLAA